MQEILEINSLEFNVSGKERFRKILGNKKKFPENSIVKALKRKWVFLSYFVL